MARGGQLHCRREYSRFPESQRGKPDLGNPTSSFGNEPINCLPTRSTIAVHYLAALYLGITRGLDKGEMSKETHCAAGAIECNWFRVTGTLKFSLPVLTCCMPTTSRSPRLIQTKQIPPSLTSAGGTTRDLEGVVPAFHRPIKVRHVSSNVVCIHVLPLKEIQRSFQMLRVPEKTFGRPLQP